MTDLGGDAPIHEVTAQAGDWMTALRRARAEIGESGGIPQGASCAVSPTGDVTILDGVGRRQYLLQVASEESLLPAAAAAPKIPADPGGPKPKKKMMAQTMAYMASPLAASAPVPVASPAAAPAAKAPSSPPQPAVPISSIPPAPRPASVVPGSAPPPGTAPVSVPPPQSVMPPAKKAAKQTVAYVLPPGGLKPEDAAPAPEPAKKKVSKHTVAYNAADLGLPGAAGAPSGAKPSAEPFSAPGVARADAAAPVSAPPAAAPVSAPPTTAAAAPLTATPAQSAPANPAPSGQPGSLPAGVELLYQREAEPSEKTPLFYLERTYVVPSGYDLDEAELVLRTQLALVREELASRRKGKLVNLAIFDHRWEGRPQRSPIVALQWKDWRGEPEISRPTASQPPAAPMSTPPQSMPPQSAPPQAAAAPAPAPQAAAPVAVGARPSSPAISAAPASAPPRRSRVPSSPGMDERLTDAFEALQDLFFLPSPFEGAEFTLNLVRDLVPCEGASICLYDINTDELRFVALAGPGSDERKGEAVPARSGLLGAGAETKGTALLLEEVSSDLRFDPGIDGRVGLEPTTMAVVRVAAQGRLLGVMQLINRVGQAQFSRSDANVLVYVGEKFGEFLAERKAAADRPRPGR